MSPPTTSEPKGSLDGNISLHMSQQAGSRVNMGFSSHYSHIRRNTSTGANSKTNGQDITVDRSLIHHRTGEAVQTHPVARTGSNRPRGECHSPSGYNLESLNESRSQEAEESKFCCSGAVRQLARRSVSAGVPKRTFPISPDTIPVAGLSFKASRPVGLCCTVSW